MSDHRGQITLVRVWGNDLADLRALAKADYRSAANEIGWLVEQELGKRPDIKPLKKPRKKEYAR